MNSVKYRLLLLNFMSLCSVINDTIPPASNTDSLYRICTVLSKCVSSIGSCEFSYSVMLNGREIFYANETTQGLVAKQDWVRQKLSADEWKKENELLWYARDFFLKVCPLINESLRTEVCDMNTQPLSIEEKWKTYLKIIMTLMGHNESDSELHVLQNRRGCEVEELPGGNGTFLRGVDEYGYDGDNFISFNVSTMHWETSIDKAKPVIEILDRLDGVKLYIKDLLEQYCVDKDNEFRVYQSEYLRNKSAAPDVFVFAKRSPTPTTVVLTCWATGFYLRHVSVNIRRNDFPVPETNLTASGVRPNGDGTYQLWKSVEIPHSDEEHYDCYVNYRILKEPVIVKWDGKCSNCDKLPYNNGIVITIVLVILFILAVVVFAALKCHKRATFDQRSVGEKPNSYGSFEEKEEKDDQ